ncbi:MAG: VWA domain-containing protein, partial [Thermoguttaceae bacterium]|nr:VWA domain-containing protein [Thermoguttaceae bacterium]
MKNRLFKVVFALLAAPCLWAAPALNDAQTARADSETAVPELTLSSGNANIPVSVETFEADGTTHLLVSLQGPQQLSGPVDVVVLVDTSAAQMGKAIRTRAEETVSALISGLPKGSRVNLMTADSQTNSLTGGLTEVNSPAMAKALDALKKNTPMGAMDLGGALAAATEALADDGADRRSIVFVGRGLSTGTVFSGKEVDTVTRQMRDSRVTFSAYGNGTMVDNNTLSVLAYQTGGYVVDPNVDDGQTAGELLAKSEEATVYWPQNTAGLDGVDLHPSLLPPIRSDRETAVVGTTTESVEPGQFQVEAVTADGQEIELDYAFRPRPSSDNNAWLRQVSRQASSDDGLTLPFAGRRNVDEYKATLKKLNSDNVAAARDALEEGNPQQAKQIVMETAEDAPETEGLQEVLDAAIRDSEMFQRAEETLDNQESGVSLMDASESNRRLLSSKLKTEVKASLDRARKLMKSEPDAAIQEVKLTIATVQNDPYLSDGDRQELMGVLTSNARLLEREKFELEKRRLIALRNNAIVDSITAVNNQRYENQRKVEEIMKRFHALMSEGQFVLAADVATKAADLLDDDVLPTQAASVARIADAWAENQYLRIYRRLRFLDVLMSVERSHIPMSDEPPILYPDAETWIALSKARKEKYSDTSLFSQTDMQRRILKAMTKVVDVKVEGEDGLPLADWFNKMRTELDINIIVDRAAMEEDPEIGSLDECVIDDSFYGITFRSALNIILRKYNLAYCVCDEYLWITTQDTIDNIDKGDDLWRQMYSMRFYPVSDLTLHPSSGMGGMGGMGGMMGGMGGMMGGMGGMGMGGMGGMMGGGMGGGWNVPAAADERPADSADAADSANAAAGTLSTVAANLDEKWDNWFAANAPKQPAPCTEGTEEERAEKNQAAADQYTKQLYDFGMKFMSDIYEMTKNKEYEEASAALKSAIRADLASGWMYEALVLVQIQMEAPQAEIEKTILSALEFTDNPITILGIAGYLETVGSSAKALELYREISKKDPTRPEPYVRSLALAKELDDEEAQKWVVLGIASGAWEGDLVHDVWEAGGDLAKELIEKMTADGREAEAAAFQEELNKALVRDMVIDVIWTGDAEIDIAVQEPIKTVCWFAQPRTAAGGILQTRTVYEKSFDDQKEGSRSKTYVCPVAFNGEYNVVVSKTWGDLPQNKVKVVITTCIGTEYQKSAEYPLDMEAGKALFTVNMEHGRRSEEVKQEMLTAAALMNQMMIQNDRQTAEKVRQFQDRKAKAEARRAGANQSYVSSYQSENGAESTAAEDAQFVSPEVKYTLDPDSGYMPVISFLSLGAMFYPQLGITPDRRYLLINPNQSFSGLVRMFQYNTYGGNSGGMGGGYGGGMGGGYGGGMGGRGGM